MDERDSLVIKQPLKIQELENDEKFIGMFGDLLYQSDKTAIAGGIK